MHSFLWNWRRAVVLTLLVLASAGAAAEDAAWPSKPVRIMVPYPPGTGPDLMARVMADGVGKALKATVIVENKPGANAVIGTDAVVKAPADGYTFLLVDRLTLSVNPLLYQPLPFDPRKDLVSVSNVADVNLYLVTSSAIPATDFKSFIAHARSNPETVAFGTGGVGSIMHLNMELLQAGTGVRFLHVPFKALAEVIPAMLGGHVTATSGGVEAMLPYIASGKFRLLAVGAPNRTAIAPNVPTIAEASGADLLLSTSYTLHARAGTSPRILARMQAALAEVLASPEVQAFANPKGLGAHATRPGELDAQIARDSERVTRLVRERGIKVQ